ncbi:MAG: molecular chaperone TorD family protein [Nitrospira sp.]|jgi:TorA maturation chaperone TorD|nr:molecular chaperone TorD family protein [Nitrospira sp.]MDH4236085.1 molecular chaperone TorD family protein [Nitrospira sp.]MDH4327704.1 molecular chaperone TorD family protein [Nitrospira sp.]MDH5251699.1 molecular chaperone TorD family protein [Nitrospira sp.]MDH5625224.1 molecular chaperone TorD family protein [Nitrospira sp.]
MTSKQPVPSASHSAAAVVPAPSTIKDSPAVERALNRSKIYLLVSWSLLYPEDEEFLEYLRCGEFVEDGRTALDTLQAMLDGNGGERAVQKIHALKKQLDVAETLIASECANWQLSDLQSEHRRVFSNVITLDCPPYETLFGNDHVFAQSHVMGDISGFYKAFGVELSKDIHERLDHLSVEFEFMHFLTYKESYSRCHDGAEKTQIVVDAQKKFVKNHIGRWVPLFCRMLAKKADSGLFKLVADMTADWMDFEMAFLGVAPQPYTETDYRPATFNSPEGQTYECGAQDQGNELTLLLNEVGAQSFLDVKDKDKEKDEKGPVGTA